MEKRAEEQGNFRLKNKENYAKIQENSLFQIE